MKNNANKSPTTSLPQNIGRIVLGITLGFAGISHLSWSRGEFLAQVPEWLPLDGDFVVIASGVVEIILGLALLFLVQRKTQVGWTVAAFSY